MRPSVFKLPRLVAVARLSWVQLHRMMLTRKPECGRIGQHGDLQEKWHVHPIAT
jgi:hypothetical protein